MSLFIDRYYSSLSYAIFDVDLPVFSMFGSNFAVMFSLSFFIMFQCLSLIPSLCITYMIAPDHALSYALVTSRNAM